MTKVDILHLLKDLPNDAKVNLYLIPKDKGIAEHSDENDLLLSDISVIYNGDDYDEPFMDLGCRLIINDNILNIQTNESY